LQAKAAHAEARRREQQRHEAELEAERGEAAEAAAAEAGRFSQGQSVRLAQGVAVEVAAAGVLRAGARPGEQPPSRPRTLLMIEPAWCSLSQWRVSGESVESQLRVSGRVD
jgi:hypothetical protein